MQITALGDCAVLVRVAENFDEAPDRSLREVVSAHRCLIAAKIPSVVELVPAYTTIALFYDPVRAAEAGAPTGGTLDWLEQQIRQALANAADDGANAPKVAVVEVPVCYDAEFALDLDEVAQRAGLSASEVVNLHAGADYRVHCVGFIGGFPFLGGLPPKLATPRRASPRKEIPAGSVGIGGKQTGIYPVKSPGGWNIIGRTPLRLFDPEQNPPGLLRTGDRVRFRAIDREQFERAIE